VYVIPYCIEKGLQINPLGLQLTPPAKTPFFPPEYAGGMELLQCSLTGWFRLC